MARQRRGPVACGLGSAGCTPHHVLPAHVTLLGHKGLLRVGRAVVVCGLPGIGIPPVGAGGAAAYCMHEHNRYAMGRTIGKFRHTLLVGAGGRGQEVPHCMPFKWCDAGRDVPWGQASSRCFKGSRQDPARAW